MAFGKKNKGGTKKIPLLDLHGSKQDEVYDQIDRFLTTEIKKGSPTVHIMTGKGKGIVKSETLRYLKQAGYTWRHDGNNEGIVVVPML